MAKILVFAEFQSGHLKRSTLELFTAAQASGLGFSAMAVGAGADAVSAEMSAWGASEVHLVKDEKFNRYNPELFASTFADIIKSSGAEIVLASASSLARDLFPQIAARLQAGIASDCTGLDLKNLTVRKPIFSGKCFATLGFENCAIKIILMRANQLEVGSAKAANESKKVDHAAPAMDLKTLIKDVVKGTSEKLDLTEANIIVSGGRGLKEAGNFKFLNELASVLGATVGASRAVVDAGWVPHDMQVGQTGKTVAPTLYIAVGISGAIQHLAGMSGSKVIVAINTDANAPIFQKATYGIVADFQEVLPQLTAEFKRVLA